MCFAVGAMSMCLLQAVSVASQLVSEHKSKLTVLVVDEKSDAPEAQEKRIQSITW
jgi:hypothetical protein